MSFLDSDDDVSTATRALSLSLSRVSRAPAEAVYIAPPHPRRGRSTTAFLTARAHAPAERRSIDDPSSVPPHGRYATVTRPSQHDAPAEAVHRHLLDIPRRRAQLAPRRAVAVEPRHEEARELRQPLVGLVRVLARLPSKGTRRVVVSVSSSEDDLVSYALERNCESAAWARAASCACTPCSTRAPRTGSGPQKRTSRHDRSSE
jgi:hypothetical protein